MEEKWEEFKMDLKKKAIERSVEIKHAEQAEEKHLKQMLKDFINEENRTQGVYGDLINEVKAKLEAKDITRFQGAAIRARTDRLLADDMPSRRYLSTEKIYSREKDIAEIESRGGTTDDPKAIKQAFSQYYRDLFAFKAGK